MPKRPTLPIRLTECEYLRAESDMTGYCRACGATRGNCEPDARRYPCEACGQDQVYGVDALVERDEIEIIDG